MAKLNFTLQRECLINSIDDGGTWQTEGGKVVQNNQHIADYSSMKRIGCVTLPQDISMVCFG
jgi:hypothetical protein